MTKFFPLHLAEIDQETILTLPFERLIISTRTHWIVLIMGFISLLIIFLTLVGLNALGFLLILHEVDIFLLLNGLFISAFLFIAVQLAANWYFHLYIVTTKRIAEICYIPLQQHYVNGVLLDQVKCTEIDVERHGVIGHILDIGDISITFDRPTHHDAFTFVSVGHAREIGTLLFNQLISRNSDHSSKTIWVRPHELNKSYIIPEIIPKVGL